MNKNTVLIMAGGTGGHVFPALAIALALKEKGFQIEWLGTKRGLEADIVPKYNIPLHFVKVGGLRGKGFITRITAPLQLFYALFQSLLIIHRLKPTFVLGMGGYASGPGGLAAWLLQVPLIIHEQNAIAGVTNRILARLATKVLAGFPESFKKNRAIFTGNPVRSELLCLEKPEARLKERQGPLRLLILGGSLGSEALNRLCPEALALIPVENRPFVKHQAGKGNNEKTEQAYKKANVLASVDAFILNMADTYAWADLVICRSGALTVAELAAIGLGSILVPFPFAVDDHQTQNAKFLEQNGAAELIPQSLLDSKKLADIIVGLSKNRAKILTMAEAAKKLNAGNACEKILQQCMEVSNK